MAWSIAEVARVCGVSARTLRHYDDIGLLRPAYVAANGYRWYEQEQLRRLQRVLLLRRLGLGLTAIAEVLDGQRDELAALEQHERWLRQERDRVQRLADTVSRTIRALQGGEPMTASEMFEGFAERQAGYEAELLDSYGDGVREHLRTSRERTRDWTEADHDAAGRRWTELDERFAAILRRGVAPDAPEAQELVGEHYRAVADFWTPDRASYAGLGQVYVEDARFRQRYDALAPGLAEFLRDATAIYAERELP